MRNKRMKSIRQGAGYTQKQVADHLGISVNMLGQKENGTARYWLEEAVKLASLYKISLWRTIKAIEEDKEEGEE